MIKGSCLCGVVTYEFETATENFVLCHCNRCKKASGSAFTAGMMASGLKFLSGEELISYYEAWCHLNIAAISAGSADRLFRALLRSPESMLLGLVHWMMILE
jgi:hypothetical protein